MVSYQHVHNCDMVNNIAYKQCAIKLYNKNKRPVTVREGKVKNQTRKKPKADTLGPKVYDKKA